MSIRKIISLVLVLTLAGALCSCKNTSDGSVKDAANTIAAALVDCDPEADAATLEDMSTGLDSDMSIATVLSYLRSDRAFSLIIDRMTYVVDDSSESKGSIEVSFMMIDYVDVFESHYHEDVSEVAADLEGIDDIITVKVTMEFVKEDGEYKLDNLEEVMQQVYGFSDPGYIITTDLHGDV